MTFDGLLRDIGEFGRYQRRIFALQLLVGFPTAFQIMGIVFLAGVHDHWCSVPALDRFNITHEARMKISIPKELKNGAWHYSHCRMNDIAYGNLTESDIEKILDNENATQGYPTKKCDSWEYDRSVYTSSVVMEWDLVCDKKWLRATATSVYMAGQMVGVFVFGAIADRFGRRRSLLLSLTFLITLSFAVAFSPNYIAFTVIRFFIGCCTLSTYTTAYVLVLELMGPSWRVFAGMGKSYSWTVGNMVLAGIAFGIRDWFTLQLTLAAPAVILFSYFCLMPESPRWLYANNRRDEARVIVEKMAAVNGTKISKSVHESLAMEKDSRRSTVLDLVKTPHIRKISIVMFYIWFAIAFVYYGLYLNTSNLGGSDYINFFISAAVEVPAVFLTQMLVDRTGRRLLLSGGLLLAGLLLLLTAPIPADLNWLVITFAMAGKFFITISFTTAYVFAAELFPTVIRNVGVGASSLHARIAAMVAPYMVQLADLGKFIPIILFGAVAISAGLLSLLLPETKGRNLPQTVEEGEEAYRRTGSVFKVCTNGGCSKKDEDLR